MRAEGMGVYEREAVEWVLAQAGVEATIVGRTVYTTTKGFNALRAWGAAQEEATGKPVGSIPVVIRDPQWRVTAIHDLDIETADLIEHVVTADTEQEAIAQVRTARGYDDGWDVYASRIVQSAR